MHCVCACMYVCMCVCIWIWYVVCMHTHTYSFHCLSVEHENLQVSVSGRVGSFEMKRTSKQWCYNTSKLAKAHTSWKAPSCTARAVTHADLWSCPLGRSSARWGLAECVRDRFAALSGGSPSKPRRNPRKTSASPSWPAFCVEHVLLWRSSRCISPWTPIVPTTSWTRRDTNSRCGRWFSSYQHRLATPDALMHWCTDSRGCEWAVFIALSGLLLSA